VPELDVLVDLCRDCGATSASLTGAGLGGVVTTMIREERLTELRVRVERHYEVGEARELVRIEDAVRAGALPKSVVAAAREMRSAKRAAWASGQRFEPAAELLAALDPARNPEGLAGDAAIRLIPEDYRHQGIVLSHSVAGAGYLRPPA
jgi:hypothetical protein